MNLQQIFDCLFLFHDAATKFFELFILDIGTDVNESNYEICNYCEEDHRITYMQYREHIE
jgi:hypothetical protein